MVCSCRKVCPGLSPNYQVLSKYWEESWPSGCHSGTWPAQWSPSGQNVFISNRNITGQYHALMTTIELVKSVRCNLTTNKTKSPIGH